MNDETVTLTALPGRRWLTELTPGSLAARLGLPTEGTVEYLRLRWADAKMAGVMFREPAVISIPPLELVVSEAMSGDRMVARLEMTVRHGDLLPGEPTGVPPRPSRPKSASSWEFIVCAEEVEEVLKEVHSTVETTPARPIRPGGMPLPVVPTTLLVRTAMAEALKGDDGEIEAWFLGSVPVGALVNVHGDAADSVTELRLAGRTEPAALLRCMPSTLTGEL